MLSSLSAREFTAQHVATFWPDEPINPKVAPLVDALNDLGIYTTLSGDFYSDDLVYVDVAIEPHDAAGAIPQLPDGWILCEPFVRDTFVCLGWPHRSRIEVPQWAREQRGVTRIARRGGAVTAQEAQQVAQAVSHSIFAEV
jgi:hypothetical protein